MNKIQSWHDPSFEHFLKASENLFIGHSCFFILDILIEGTV